LDENDKNYKTYYQIDKSSESQLVKSYINIKSSLTSNSDLDDLSKKYLSYIISNKFENNEIIIDTPLIFKFTTFSDNTEKIITEFIDLLLEKPKKEDFDIIKASKSSDDKETGQINQNFQEYITNILNSVQNKEKTKKNEEENINQNKISSPFDNIEYNDFLNYYSKIYNNIQSIYFIIAGNIDKNLVQNIHNSIKKKN
jgi:hypothetical protein